MLSAQIQTLQTLGALSLVMLFFCAFLSTDACAEPKDEKPPLSSKRITGELLFGIAGAIGGAHSGGYIGNQIDPYGNTGFTLGCTIGSTVGSFIVIYGVGTKGRETGSLLATLGGSLVGGALGLAGSRLIKDRVPEGIMMFPVILSPPILATIGFNLTHGYDDQPAASEKALINIIDSQMSFAMPTIHLRPNPYLELVKAKF